MLQRQLKCNRFAFSSTDVTSWGLFQPLKALFEEVGSMKRNSIRIAGMLLACVLASVPAYPEQPQPNEPEADNPTSQDYRIGVGDVLNIQVWKETDLTRSVPVRPDGKISVPLLDDLQAAGLTPLELKRILTEKLKQYL